MSWTGTSWEVDMTSVQMGMGLQSWHSMVSTLLKRLTELLGVGHRMEGSPL